MQSDTIKKAQTDHPIHDLLTRRWSPYAFDDSPVEVDKLCACLEAARWSASSYNEQPWSFMIARREDEQEFARLTGCLTEKNQQWARHAGVVILTVVKRHFSRNGKPNRVAEHDLGLAAQNLTLQAVELGLHVHQMAGIHIEKARETYDIPDGYDPWTGIAIGYAADLDTAEPGFAERDRQPRTRRPLAQFVFSGAWERPAAVVEGESRG